MTKNADGNLKKYMVDLGSIVRGVSNRSDGFERTSSVLENRLENVKNSTHNMDFNYEGLMAMVA